MLTDMFKECLFLMRRSLSRTPTLILFKCLTGLIFTIRFFLLIHRE
jgi:hypothetical protein